MMETWTNILHYTDGTSLDPKYTFIVSGFLTHVKKTTIVVKLLLDLFYMCLANSSAPAFWAFPKCPVPN